MRKGSVVITGASSGIGRALAFEFARRGYDLGLTARRLEMLEQVRTDLLAKHGQTGLKVTLARLDVTHAASVPSTLNSLFVECGGVDIVVINAGANDLTRIGRGDLDKELNLIQTNLIGAIATAHAATEHFLARGHGHIVGVSSLASLQAIPKQAAYCASKAGFTMYLDAARIELKRKNIDVTKILPGFIKTDIVEGVDIGKLPFAVSPEQAAREMVTLIERKVTLGVVPGFPWKWLRPFFGHMPERFLR